MARYVHVPAFPVRVGEGDDLRSGFVERLSADGLVVRLRRLHPLDASVRVELEPPDGGAVVEIEGRVARIEPGWGETPAGMKIEFVDPAPRVVDRLTAMLAASEDLGDVAEQAVDRTGAAELQRRVQQASVAIERAEKHQARLERELESARQAERTSRHLVEQIAAKRTRSSGEHRFREMRQLVERRGQLQAELDRRRGGSEAHQSLERELGRIDELGRALEQMRGQLQHTKEAAARRLEAAREELAVEVGRRREAEARRAELEHRLATVIASVHAPAEPVRGEPKPAGEPQPLPPPPFRDQQSPPSTPATCQPQPPTSQSVPEAVLLPGARATTPPVPERPPNELTWGTLVGGTVAGSLAVVAMVLVVLLGEEPETATAVAGQEIAPTSAEPAVATRQEVAPTAERTNPAVAAEPPAEPDATGTAVEEAAPPPDEGVPTPEELLDAARELRRTKRFKLALEAYEKAAPVNHDSYQLHVGIGHVLLELGDTERAIEHLERAVSMRPAMPQPRLYLGSAYWELEHTDQARVQLERLLELAPNSPRADEVRALLDSLE